MSGKTIRFIEIDILRCIAIFGMVTYHLLFDLVYLFSLNIKLDSGFWFYFSRSVASIFLFLFGLSSFISFNRNQESHHQKSLKFIKKGLILLFFAYSISIITYIIFPNDYIIFGILHLLGYSTFILIPLLHINSRIIYFLLSVVIIFISSFSKQITLDNPILIPLGITPSNFSSFDYFPLLPWFSIIPLGMLIGSIYYPWRIKRSFLDQPNLLLKSMQFIGRHSFQIYLIHQPLMLTFLYLIKQTI